MTFIHKEGLSFPLFYALRVLHASKEGDVGGYGWLYPLMDRTAEANAMRDLKRLVEARRRVLEAKVEDLEVMVRRKMGREMGQGEVGLGRVDEQSLGEYGEGEEGEEGEGQGGGNELEGGGRGAGAGSGSEGDIDSAPRVARALTWDAARELETDASDDEVGESDGGDSGRNNSSGAEDVGAQRERGVVEEKEDGPEGEGAIDEDDGNDGDLDARWVLHYVPRHPTTPSTPSAHYPTTPPVIIMQMPRLASDDDGGGCGPNHERGGR